MSNSATLNDPRKGYLFHKQFAHFVFCIPAMPTPVLNLQDNWKIADSGTAFPFLCKTDRRCTLALMTGSLRRCTFTSCFLGSTTQVSIPMPHIDATFSRNGAGRLLGEITSASSNFAPSGYTSSARTLCHSARSMTKTSGSAYYRLLGSVGSSAGPLCGSSYCKRPLIIRRNSQQRQSEALLVPATR